MSDEADEADEATGPRAKGAMPETPACPFCDGRETELMNAFGSHASVSTYWCRRCRSPFELFRWRGARGTSG